METGTTGVIRTAFASVSCSQCGKGFGPGRAGFSSCLQHRQPPVIKSAEDPNLEYVEFHSKELGGSIRCGLDVEDKNEVIHYQFGPVGAGVSLYEVWIGGMELSLHLEQSTKNVLEFEACAAMAAKQELAA